MISQGFKDRWCTTRPWRRHSLVLMVAGFAYMTIGLSYILAEPSPGRAHALVLALSWFPIPVWGAIFMACGLMSVISSRWPPMVETWGYVVLTGLSAGWSATYGCGVLFAGSPSSNLSGAISWGLIAFMWWAISGLINPDKVVVLVSHGSD